MRDCGLRWAAYNNLYCQKWGWTLLASAVVSLIIFSYQGDGILIGNKCYLATENKSTSVSADGTQNIPPSAIPERCMAYCC